MLIVPFVSPLTRYAEKAKRRRSLYAKRCVFIFFNNFGSTYLLLLLFKDCEYLENDICSQEYAIAKKHHLLGRVVHLPNCSSLPKTDCFELGIEKPEVNEGT